MKLSRLLAPLGITEGYQETEITDIVYDSRKAKQGCAFVCMRGSNSDGHKYAAGAAQAGAAVIVAEEPVEAPGAQVVLVPDTRKALALLSAAFFGNPAEGDISVIGVTGTKGKTTTAYMIRSILEAAGHKTGVIGTIGVLMGEELIQTDNTTPMSYDIQMYLRRMADAGCRYCVMEASSIGFAGLRLPLFRGGVHQLLRGPHRRGGAQGHAGVYGEQGEAVLSVQGGRGQRRRP